MLVEENMNERDVGYGGHILEGQAHATYCASIMGFMARSARPRIALKDWAHQLEQHGAPWHRCDMMPAMPPHTQPST